MQVLNTETKLYEPTHSPSLDVYENRYAWAFCMEETWCENHTTYAYLIFFAFVCMHGLDFDRNNRRLELGYFDLFKKNWEDLMRHRIHVDRSTNSISLSINMRLLD